MAAPILLPIAAAQPPDGSASNAAPALTVAKGTATAPASHSLVAQFDASTDEHLWWTFTMPDNYSSGGTFRLLWEANAITGSVVWAVRVGAITPADVDTPVEHAQAAATTATTAANTTEARRLVETTISPSMDSVAANDLVKVLVYRDADNASDTCAVDATLWSVELTYTAA